MLGDDPLDALFFDDLEKQDALFPDMIAEFDVRDGGEDFFQEFLSSDEGQARQIMPLEMEEIKDVVEQMAATGFQVILQHLEIGMAPIVHDDDFAVQNGIESEFPERVRQWEKTSG